MLYRDLANWLSCYAGCSRGPNVHVVRTLEDARALRRWNAVLRTGVLTEVGDRAIWRVALAVRVRHGTMTKREAAKLLGLSVRGFAALSARCRGHVVPDGLAPSLYDLAGVADGQPMPLPAPIPSLPLHCGSWVIVRRATGEGVMETFSRALRRWNAVLARVNAKARATR